MSNPWSQVYDDLRKPYLEGKMAKKDYDGDGKIESGTDEYKGSVDNAIKKKIGKKVTEHHQKDADGNVVEHGDGTPASLDELSIKTLDSYRRKASKDLQRPDKKSYGKGNKFARTKSMLKAADEISRKEKGQKEEVEQEEISYTAAYLPSEEIDLSVQEGAPYTVNVADKTGNTQAYQNMQNGMLNKLTGKPLYKAGVGLDKAHYEPAKVSKPNFSNWREDFVWGDEVEEAVKRPKLDIQEKGVKNKVEINPDDGLKESEKKN